MKKILNIALGEISTGELSIAIEFAKNLNAEKYDCHFLIPKDKLKIIDGNRRGGIFTVSTGETPNTNLNYILSVLEKEKYDMIILFDIFTFEYSQIWTGLTSDMLLDKGTIIVSLDEYEYTKAGYQLDYYGLLNKRLPPLLNKCDFIIKNCPLAIPKSGADCFAQGDKANEYYYRAMGRLKKIDDKEKKAVREKYITRNSDAKVVFFTTSQWEIKGAYAFAAQKRLVTWLGAALFEYLKMLDDDIVLLHVGSGNWNIPADDDKVKYVHCDGFPVGEFEKILQSADLYVTFNLVSITLSKAVMFGIPSLVFNNNKIIDFTKLGAKLSEKPKWYQELAADVKKIYPFTASMFGWNKFLRTIMRDNSYIDTFERSEMFIIRKAVHSLEKMLYDDDYINCLLKKNESFIEKYYGIPDSGRIVDDIFSRCRKDKIGADDYDR